MSDKCYSCGTINPSLSVCDDCNMKLVEGVNKLQAERDELQKRVEELEEANKILSDGLSDIGIAVAKTTSKESQ